MQDAPIHQAEGRRMTDPTFESCGRDRHHYPHLVKLLPPSYADPIPYDLNEGVIVDLATFEPVVCPGAGSDAMDVPEPKERKVGG
jgi:hypothetical protein